MEKKWQKWLGVAAVTFALAISIETVSSAEDTLNTTADLSLTIHKYKSDEPGDVEETIKGSELTEEQLPQNCAVFSGVTYQIYKVASGTKGTEIPQTTNLYSGEMETISSSYSEVTDENGEVHISNLEEGRYLIVEANESGKEYERAKNFLVDVPMLKQEGNGWIQDVHIYSKSVSILGAVVLSQRGEGTDSMKGTAYRLEKRAGQVWDLIDIYEANEEGKIIVKDLEKGEYRFVQESIPEDYGPNKTPIGFNVNQNYTIENGNIYGAEELSAQAYRLPEEPITTPDQESVAQGAVVRWTIIPDVPVDIENYTKYMVTDTLDSRLTYLRTQVMLNDEDITSQTGVSYTNGTLTVAFPQIIYENIKDKTLKILVETTVNSNALSQPGYIPNEATHIFNHGLGDDISLTGNPGEVFTGNLKIFQYSGTETPLSGAVFSLYESEKTARSGTEEGKMRMNVSTDQDGEAIIAGLEEGIYWLKEVQAPQDKDGEEYTLLKDPIKVEIFKDKATGGEVTIAVKNIKTGYAFSDEGSAGTLIFVILGLIICGGATLTLEHQNHKHVIRHRRRSRIKASV